MKIKKKAEKAVKRQCRDFVGKRNTETVRRALALRVESVLLLESMALLEEES